MAVRKDTIWDNFLKPIFSLLIDQEKLREMQKNIDWERETEIFRQKDLNYPDYYISQNFHGIEGGYLNSGAAITYDPITQYVLPPSENWLRQEVISTIGGTPNRILDLGCGTGSTTLMLKQAFPNATVMGLDLSPYMLVMAAHKAKEAGLNLRWRHGLAEATGLPSESYDVITISLLFHETPPEVAQSILHECFRLLTPGGQVIIFDGNQKTLRQTEWLTNIFEEPYIIDYAAGSVDAWLGAAGFQAVQTEELWWVNQVSKGVKPSLKIADQVTEISMLDQIPSPVF